MQARGSSHACTPPVCLQYGLKCPGQARKVAVVDTTVVQLVRELAEQLWPVSASGFERDADLDLSFDQLDCGSP